MDQYEAYYEARRKLEDDIARLRDKIDEIERKLNGIPPETSQAVLKLVGKLKK